MRWRQAPWRLDPFTREKAPLTPKLLRSGIPGKPALAAVWREKKILDDPVVESNKRGYLSFATSGKDSRTTQSELFSRGPRPQARAPPFHPRRRAPRNSVHQPC